MRVRLSKTIRFEAAHFLPTFPEGHKCRRMHGHSFVVDVVVEGIVAEDEGYLVDYGQIGEICEPLRRQLDHYLLNDIEGLENPTAENLARWIWVRLQPKLEAFTETPACATRRPPQLSEVIVCETCTSACHYRGE